MTSLHPNTRHFYNRACFSRPTIENCNWGGFIAADGSVKGAQEYIDRLRAEREAARDVLIRVEA